MTSTFKFLTILAAIFLMFSFTEKNANEFIGTYGVSVSDPSQIKLIINSDHTFYFQDFSIPNKIIIVNGNWTQKGKKLILNDNKSEHKFHNVWTFTKNGQVAKSRKGLSFYRLCKFDN